MIFKDRLEEYTEQEFLSLVSVLFENRTGLHGIELEQYRDRVVYHFEKITEHPEGLDVICYPPPGSEDSPQGVVSRVKEWRAANGKPGFKPA
ncbi:bacteriocin immunity protein [Pseudomonas sp. CC120222-01a]|uniref:bacteriocin immunity protein n=1 Tax=Pseudomonas sp. CC120222-01a TaxID=1378075 RepID=UPI000D811DD2|nr:bacteriocin immunity protein [Pseudomonas sp. CC120222-01a]PVZ42966.1 colicin immunity protein/pyocin immunity protein [Pseudomonas sp. CC120222-01a]